MFPAALNIVFKLKFLSTILRLIQSHEVNNFTKNTTLPFPLCWGSLSGKSEQCVSPC